MDLLQVLKNLIGKNKMVNYLLSDMVSKINIGLKSKARTVKVLRSKYIINILIFLYKEGIIRGFSYTKNNKKKNKLFYIDIFLKYVKNRSIIFDLKIISSPGRRIYMGYDQIKKKYGLNTIVLISTNKGIITNRDLYLKRLKVGGELLLQFGLI